MKKNCAFFISLALIMLAKIDAVLAQESFLPPSPTSIAMIKATESNVNLYSGKVNINIPIYTIKEGSLSSSINLKYIGGSGIKVQEIGSEVGLGWALMAGGVISRTIRQGADEAAGGYCSNSGSGYLKSNPGSSEFQKAFAAAGELEPDIFNSTIGGRIIFDRDKKPHFINELGLKIKQDGIFSADQSWVIVDTQGNNYYFGETINSRERYCQTTSGGVQSLTNQINSWRLNKIVSASGSSITFEYAKTGKLSRFEYYSFSKTFNSINNTWSNYLTPTPSPSEEIHLSKIKTSTLTIDFLYKEREDFKNTNALSEVKVLDKQGELLTKYVFETDYFKSADPEPTLRLKLNAIKQYDNTLSGTHLITAFNYNELENLPGRNSEKFDHWGYYNNNTTGKYFLSEGANKATDLNKCQANILTSISWPTGATTRYNYELNTYRRNGIDYIGGGLRVFAVSEINSDNTALTTKYDYMNTNGGTKMTTGLLHSLFDITKGYIFKTKTVSRDFNSEVVYLIEKALPLTKAIDLDDISVGYSQVTVVHPDQASEVYSFQDYQQFPDEVKKYSYTSFPFARPVKIEDFSLINDQLDEYNGFDAVTSNALQRGVIKRKDLRNSEQVLIKSFNYKYNIFTGAEIPGAEIKSNETYLGKGDWEDNAKMFYETSLYYEHVMAVQLVEVKEDHYFPDNNDLVRSTTTINEYKDSASWPFLLAKQIQKQPDESTLAVEYNYPSDMISLGKDVNHVYQDMVEKNMIAQVVEKRESIDNKQVSLSRTNFGLFNNKLPLPKNIEVRNGNNPMEIRTLFNRYDFNGNLLEQQQPDGVKTSYQWNDYGQYPVAKIVNAEHGRSVSYTNNYDYRRTKQSYTLPTNSGEFVINFTTGQMGDLNITLPGYLGEDWAATYSIDYNTYSGGLLSRRSFDMPATWEPYTRNDINPNYYVLSKTFNNFPAGDHTMLVYPDNRGASPGSSSGQLYLEYAETYIASIDTTITGKDEFFYNGFNEGLGEGVPYFPFAGQGHYLGHYTVPFKTEGSRKYKIDYRYFKDQRWQYTVKDYQDGMVLDDGIAIDEVRVYPEDAQIATYTYEPLIGMTSQTDAKGQTVFYEYDSFQRLQNIKDQNGNIIKNYDYHYQNGAVPASKTYSNIEIKQTFKRDNCNLSLGEIGKEIDYIVPSGKYTSSISQADANLKAYKDLTSNGQNYANENGECGAYVMVSVHNPTDQNCVLEYAYGRQGSISSTYYTVPPDMHNNPTVLYIPRLYYRYVSMFVEQEYENKVFFSMMSNGPEFNTIFSGLVYDINEYQDIIDDYFIREK